MSKILVASDGSGSSERAEEYITKLYHPSRDSVLVLSSAHVPGIIGGEIEGDDQASPNIDIDNLDEQFLTESKSIVENVAKRLREEGFDVETVVREGSPGPEICEVAEEEDIDVIMMGRRGQGDSDQPYLGSVSQYVVHNADCPVNVIPH